MMAKKRVWQDKQWSQEHDMDYDGLKTKRINRDARKRAIERISKAGKKKTAGRKVARNPAKKKTAGSMGRTTATTIGKKGLLKAAGRLVPGVGAAVTAAEIVKALPKSQSPKPKRPAVRSNARKR